MVSHVHEDVTSSIKDSTNEWASRAFDVSQTAKIFGGMPSVAAALPSRAGSYPWPSRRPLINDSSNGINGNRLQLLASAGAVLSHPAPAR